MKRISLLLILILAFFIRFGTINQGLPYFYNEDEAHHFNRIVKMVQAGTFDPKYFHKPSLHFYLRMPIVAASFLWNVSKGNIRKIEEIDTTSKSGVAGYAFSATHPSIVKWNRAFSLFLSVISVLLIYLICAVLGMPAFFSLSAAALGALSPAWIQESSVIGVDVFVVFFCLLTSLFSLLNLKTRQSIFLLLSSICAGLAIGSKYNALPIVLVPSLCAVFGVSGVAGAVWVLVISLTTFFVTSPFIFAHIPMFLNDFAYEIWHYKIAGHEGHMANPGWDQIQFYSNWFSSQALSTVTCISALLGVLLGFKLDKKNWVILITFPIIYFLMMSMQRANFTRNVIVLIPYLCILSVASSYWLYERVKIVGFILPIFCIVSIIPGTWGVLKSYSIVESRVKLVSFLNDNPQKNIAIDSKLQVAASAFSTPNIVEETSGQTAENLYLKGYDYFVTYTDNKFDNAKLANLIPGEPIERIVKNPSISIYELSSSLLGDATRKRELSNNPVVSKATLNYQNGSFVCSNKAEPYCWLNTRISKISIPNIQDDPHFGGINGMVSVTLKLMTYPEQPQGVKISFEDFLADITLSKISKDKIEELKLDLPYQELKSEKGFFITFANIKKPSSWIEQGDKRSLGIAIQALTINQR